MEARTIVFRSWEDLVFINRNHAYGAYLIRKAYSKRVIIGFGVTVALVILLLFIPGPVRQHIKIPFADKDIPFVVLPPPSIEHFKPQHIEHHAEKKTTNNNTTVKIVKQQVEVEVSNDVVVSLPDFDGMEGFSEIIPEGAGTMVSLPVSVHMGPVVHAEVMPAYKGGMEALMKFIKKKIHYPGSAKRQHIEGTVYVSFVVNGDGSVSDVAVIRGIDKDCDEEAKRVISLLPDWMGGRQGGFPVAVKMVLPIKFSLK